MATFKGTYNDARTVAMLNEVDRLTPNIPFYPSQGGFNKGGVAASAGTHDRAAVDIKVGGLSNAQRAEIVRIMRMVGFAAWQRYAWQGFSGDHIHAVPVGGDISAGAAAQVRAYFNGRDGLRGNRVDTEPRQYVGVTWEKYCASKKGGGAGAAAGAPAAGARSPLAVDGVFGPATIRRFQHVLGTYEDGVWGPASKKALQKWVGVTQDGAVGPVTIKAFQTKIGAYVDGDWGPGTTRSLQRYLNSH